MLNRRKLVWEQAGDIRVTSLFPLIWDERGNTTQPSSVLANSSICWETDKKAAGQFSTTPADCIFAAYCRPIGGFGISALKGSSGQNTSLAVAEEEVKDKMGRLRYSSRLLAEVVATRAWLGLAHTVTVAPDGFRSRAVLNGIHIDWPAGQNHVVVFVDKLI